MSGNDTSEEWVRIGARIRAARTAAGLSVRELARRIAVSSSHVSQVERGLASFSVRTLYSVATVLELSMDSLFEEPPAEDNTDDRAHATPLPGRGIATDGPDIVLRADARPGIPLEGGTRWERLTPRAEVGAEFIEVIYSAGQQEPPPSDFVRHNSREYGVVLSGTLTVQVGFEQAVLHPGDSIAFDSHIPHRFWNGSGEEVRAVWFIRENTVNDPDDPPTPLHPGARRSLRRSN